MLTEHARRVTFSHGNSKLNPLQLIKRWKLATIERLRHIDVDNDIVPGKPLPDMESLWNQDQDKVAQLEKEPLTVRYGFMESDVCEVFYKRHKDGEAEGLTAQMRKGIRSELKRRRDMRSRAPRQHPHERRKGWNRSTPEVQMLQDFVSYIVCYTFCTSESNIHS